MRFASIISLVFLVACASIAGAPNPSGGKAVGTHSNYDPYIKRQFSNPGSTTCCDAS
jgi:hypothetical protein